MLLVKNKVILFTFLFLISLYEFNGPYKALLNGTKNHSKFTALKSKVDETVKLFPVDFGNPYMNHFQFGQSDLQIWAISQDADGVMIFAHRQGLIIFNGKDWEQIKVPATPLVLKSLAEEQMVFLGCDNQYGYIQRNQMGLYEYHQLSENSAVNNDITDIKITDKFIFFYSDKMLFRHDRKDLSIVQSWQVSEKNTQNGIIQIDNDIYISLQNKGFYKFNGDDKKKIIPRTQILATNQTAFSVPFAKNKVLVGNFGNNLYVFDGKTVEEFKTSAQKYISDNQLINAVDLSEKLFAISTITGGSIIVNKETGAIVSILDIKSGLPDNEIYSIGKDLQGGLWLSHGFGVSRVNYNLPVKDFNYYQGIEGNILDVVVVNNKTYIATTQGVFYQDSILVKKEIEVSNPKRSIQNVKSNQIKIDTINIVANELKNDEVTQDEEEILPVLVEKKGLIQRFRDKREAKKKKKKEEQEKQSDKKTELKESTKEKVIEEPKLNESNLIKPKTDINPRNRNYSKAKTQKSQAWSINYSFKKINNINGKCKQLISYQNLLLVASNNGLYEVDDKTSKIILKKNYINCIVPSKIAGIFYIGTDKGITAIKRENNKWVEKNKIQPIGFEDPVYTIAEDEKRNLWIGNDNEVFYFIEGIDLTTISYEMRDFGNEFPDKFSIKQIDNNIYFLSSKSVYKYNTANNTIEIDNRLIENKLPFLKSLINQSEITWLQNEKGWVCKSNKFRPSSYQIALLNLFENIQNIYVDSKNNIWVVDGKNSLYKILSTANLENNEQTQKAFIQRIKTDQGNNVNLKKIVIPSEINSLTFTISAPSYLKPSGILYQYYIKGVMKDWSEWKTNQEFDYLVHPGHFTLKVRAKNILGEISESVEYDLDIKTPIYHESWFVGICLALFLSFVSLIIFLIQKKREIKLQMDNQRLEIKVEERTIEIVFQKEQIEQKNREITDSLNYASQIQAAVLPPTNLMKESLDEYFILNKPKDIVSGDFYWINKVENQLVVSVGDCTGHGVPGAFLSMLGVTFLNEITSKMEVLRSNLILELLRNRVIKSLNQGNFDKKRLDGIDLALALIDFSKMELQFAGANNSIYLMRNGFLSEFKGNRMPIGLHAHKDKPFTNHDIEIKKGDLVYLFSDGYIDQFGGDYGRKFLSRNFKVLLTEIYQLPLKEQCDILLDVHNSWKAKYDQIDDILVIGLKI